MQEAVAYSAAFATACEAQLEVLSESIQPLVGAAVLARREAADGSLEFFPVAVWPSGQGVFVVGEKTPATRGAPSLPGSTDAACLLSSYPFLPTDGSASPMPDGGLSVPLVYKAQMLGVLAGSHTKQINRVLTTAIPVVSGLMWDTKAAVKDAATATPVAPATQTAAAPAAPAAPASSPAEATAARPVVSKTPVAPAAPAVASDAPAAPAVVASPVKAAAVPAASAPAAKPKAAAPEPVASTTPAAPATPAAAVGSVAPLAPAVAAASASVAPATPPAAPSAPPMESVGRGED